MSTSYLSWRICHILKDKLQHILSLRNFAFAHVPEFSPDRGIGARGKTNYVFFPLYFFGKYLEIAEIWVWKQKICSKTQYFQATNTWLEPKSLFFLFCLSILKASRNFPPLFGPLKRFAPSIFNLFNKLAPPVSKCNVALSRGHLQPHQHWKGRLLSY